MHYCTDSTRHAHSRHEKNKINRICSITVRGSARVICFSCILLYRTLPYCTVPYCTLPYLTVPYCASRLDITFIHRADTCDVKSDSIPLHSSSSVVRRRITLRIPGIDISSVVKQKSQSMNVVMSCSIMGWSLQRLFKKHRNS